MRMRRTLVPLFHSSRWILRSISSILIFSFYSFTRSRTSCSLLGKRSCYPFFKNWSRVLFTHPLSLSLLLFLFSLSFPERGEGKDQKKISANLSSFFKSLFPCFNQLVIQLGFSESVREEERYFFHSFRLHLLSRSFSPSSLSSSLEGEIFLISRELEKFQERRNWIN